MTNQWFKIGHENVDIPDIPSGDYQENIRSMISKIRLKKLCGDLFTPRGFVDRAVHQLSGMLKGIAIDDRLSGDELTGVLDWVNENRRLVDRAPFNDLIPKLDAVLQDGVISAEERDDLIWMLKNLSPDGDYYDFHTRHIQLLLGILQGIRVDGIITSEEAVQLHIWMQENDFLKGTYPYDELFFLLEEMLLDGHIDLDERQKLKSFLDDFISHSSGGKNYRDDKSQRRAMQDTGSISSVCSISPDIYFPDHIFSFSRAFPRAVWNEFTHVVSGRGGIIQTRLSVSTDYLVVPCHENPCWIFSASGRLIEKALKLRRDGSSLMIILESDFRAAVGAPDWHGIHSI